MARIVKNKEQWHEITIKPNRHYHGGEMVLVTGGGSPYLSIHGENEYAGAYSGRKTLRALAHAILKACSDDFKS